MGYFMNMIILNDNNNIYELYIAHFENDRENARINEKRKKGGTTPPRLGFGLCFLFVCADPIQNFEQKRINADRGGGHQKIPESMENRRFVVSAEQLFQTDPQTEHQNETDQNLQYLHPPYAFGLKSDKAIVNQLSDHHTDSCADEDICVVNALHCHRDIGGVFGKRANQQINQQRNASGASDQKKDVQLTLIQLIKELGEPDSTIILHKYYYDRSSGEIAKLLNMKATNVRMRCKRALEKLRLMLKVSGIDL